MVQQADGPSGQTLELFISPNNLSQQQMKYGVFKVQKKKTLHYFKKIANEGHYRKTGGTRQGIYVCSPSGKLLSSVNSLNPEVVIETINQGLEGWKNLPALDKRLPENFSPFTSHRWEDSYPENGLILKGAKADLISDPPNPSDRGDRWNMDHVWFSEQESHLWIPKIKNIRRGKDREFIGYSYDGD